VQLLEHGIDNLVEGITHSQQTDDLDGIRFIGGEQEAHPNLPVLIDTAEDKGLGNHVIVGTEGYDDTTRL